MLILSLCDVPDFLRVMKLVRTVLMIVKIVVPIILIITTMISFAGAIFKKDQDIIKSEAKNAVSKMIAAVLVFLIPTFVSLIFSALGSSKATYAGCFENATEENINAAYVAKAQKLLAEGNESTNRIDYIKAATTISNITDEQQKSELQKQLDELQQKIANRDEAERIKNSLNSSGKYIWPIYEASYITSCFGAKDAAHAKTAHGAVDTKRPSNNENTDIHAIASGKVTYPKANSKINYPNNFLSNEAASNHAGAGCGNYVVIDHEDGTTSKYCHLFPNTITVKAGDYVYQGQVLGKMGTSGNSTGYHLHLAMTINGSSVDPLLYVPMTGVTNPDYCK